MISTLAAFKEMISAYSGEKLHVQTQGNKNVASVRADPAAQTDLALGNKNIDAVSVELSASHDVFSAVDDYFNLGKSGRFSTFHALSPDDKGQFVKIVAELVKSGYMGYEELIVNKKVERHEMLTQIGDERLHNARVYDRSKNFRH
jgi:hypothetical protein